MSALVRFRLFIVWRAIPLSLGLAACGLLFSHSQQLYLAQLRRSAELALQTQKRLIAERQREGQLAKLAEKDAAVRALSLQWTNVMASTPIRARLRHDAPVCEENLAEHRETATRHNRHWAFEQLQRPPPPSVSDDSEVRNPIDQFILARLQRDGLTLRPAAAPQVLARRLWFDVTGLPPDSTELEGYFDAGPDDFDRLTDRLLATNAFGEHLAQMWLDLARYADSNGYEEDELRPHAYPYRDFVIWAFNHDLPFDDFVRWQIAGDELHEEHPLAVAATGFAAAAPYNTFMPQESERYDELDDIVSTMGAAMLGLTIGCARCHDHPYDEVACEEYYSLVSIFHPTRREIRYLLPDGGRAFRRVADPVDMRREEVREILLDRAVEESIVALDFTEAEKDLLRRPIDPGNREQIRLLSLCGRCLMVDDSFIDDETEPLPQDRERYERLLAEIDQLLPSLPPRPPQGLTLAGSKAEQTPVLWGGSLNNKGRSVGPGFLDVLTAGDADENAAPWQAWDSERPDPRPRAALANWMTDRDRGAGALVARVIVNRVWQQCFGTGLVATPSDFGLNGESSSHPELLEWLACELVSNDWSLKHIHRLILSSAAYRQDTHCSSIVISCDPENRLVSRHSRKRLTAEMFRDSLLQLGGNLNARMYGPAFQPSIPREAIFNRDGENIEDTWPTDVVERREVWRRSIYILRKRTNPVPLLRLFDAPERTFSCAKRSNTTVPTQALALWNSSFVRAQSSRIAARIMRDGSSDMVDTVDRLFLCVLGRRADDAEVSRAAEFLLAGNGLRDLCQVLLMTNEFWYVE